MTSALDVASVRRRFSSLDRATVFFDGPGGTQVPDSVIEAVASYLRTSNANVGGPFERSLESEAVVDAARRAAARFLGASVDEVGFGANMTTLNFSLSRALGRELRAGDEIVVTRLDHDANVAPWLELARDLGVVVRFADVRKADCTLDLPDLERQLSRRTRVVAFPWASNAVGTITDVRRVADLAHDAGALAWVDAVHYAPHGEIDVAAAVVDVLLCSPYKFFGPHLGLFYGRRDLLERLRAYKVRPAPEEPAGQRFETGTLPHEALAGFVAAVEYVESIGWNAIAAHERELGRRLLERLPAPIELHGIPSMENRTPTFALTLPGRSPHELAALLADRGFAVWAGDYYAVEVMGRLGLPDGAVRVGFVHYNTVEEVDRLLGELERLAST
ncbi:MAG: cysteine desulfurase-like protein [Actinomycetota bacterium]|nr:cysteine desulfurase-like protein [Actinomycetota bacterium]